MTVLIAALWRQFGTFSVRALTQSNISGSPVLRTFTSMPAFPSLLKIIISMTGPTLLPGTILSSNCPPSTGSVSFSTRYAEQSSTVSCRPSLKEFSDLQDFCLFCNFTPSTKFFVCPFGSLSRQLPFLFVDSAIAGGFPLPSIFLCLHARYFQRWCSCWEVSLRNWSTTWEIVSCIRSRSRFFETDSWTTEAVFLWLSRSIFKIFPRQSQIPKTKYRCRWLNWWDPSSFLQMHHRRGNACLHLLSSILRSGNWYTHSGLDASVQDTLQ